MTDKSTEIHYGGLKEMWEEQRDFNKLFLEPPKNLKEQTAATKDYIIGLYSQAGALMREVPWKPHRTESKLHNPAQVRNELSDILKYWISLCVVWGVSPEDAIEDFWRKSMVCRQRYSQEYVLDMNERMALVDIDGVIGDWNSLWRYWCEHWLKPGSLTDIKHSFRCSGQKRYMKVFDDAILFLERVRDADIKIILCTSRPIDKYPNLLGDTLEWLVNNQIPFDAIWWSQHKTDSNKFLAILDQIVIAVDDDYGHALNYEKMGVKSYYLNREENTDSDSDSNQIQSLEEIEINVR